MQFDPKSAPTLAAVPGQEAAPPLSDRVQVGDALLGTVIDGRYLIERILGEGGMGIVYRGRHRVIDKRVAIKVLRKEMARDREMTDRFLQEAQTASKIGNGHIVEITDFGVMPDGATYFVMEYLDGESLTTQLEKLGSLPLSRMLHIGKQIARGLAAAHAAGIVHRDLKPDNVMLLTRGEDKDFVKILDFGIAKVGSAASKITRAGSIFGTPHYMSPEQAAGTPVDARTDIYAIGVMMYEMAIGTVPFDAESLMGILSQHLYKVPVPLLDATKRTDIPPAFQAIVMKCLAKNAGDRYSSMAALVDDLDSVERGFVPLAMVERREGMPTNYFEQPTGPSGLALATDSDIAPRSSARTIAMGAVLAVAMFGVALAVFVSREKIPAAKAEPAGTSAEATPAAVAPQAAAPPPEEKLLLLSVDPLDARMFENENDLGTPPVALHLKAGDRRTVTVRRAGYATSTETFEADTLGAAEAKRLVRLTLIASPARPVTKPVPKAGAKPVITDHDPDPWKRTAR